MKRLHSIFALSLAGSLAFAGCSGDETDNNTTPPDSGVNNNNNNNNGGTDAGPSDAGTNNNNGGTDAGMPPDPCPDGTEGCECMSSLDPDAFLQDDCDTGLLCIPFDELGGRNDLTGPVQSCVRPCTVDTDCGPGQSCVASGFTEASGAGSICVDRVAQADEACGYSRGLTSRVPDPEVTIETGGEIVGCAPTYNCQFGFLGDFNPDEGVCLSFCEADSDCGGDTPYCNPSLFSRTSTTGETVPVGACSVEKIPQGGICSNGIDGKNGYTTACDTAPDAVDNTFCVSIGNLTPDGYGICMTVCDDGATFGGCTAMEPDGTPQICSGPFFVGGQGTCHTACDNYPDTCSGDGEFGNGRFCMNLLNDGSEPPLPIGICMDRREPILNAATVDSGGNITNPGDNCFAPGGSLAFTQCPNPGHCEIVDFQRGQGVCVVGCETADADYCPSTLGTMTATCATVFQQGGNPVTDIGLCGDN